MPMAGAGTQKGKRDNPGSHHPLRGGQSPAARAAWVTAQAVRNALWPWHQPGLVPRGACTGRPAGASRGSHSLLWAGLHTPLPSVKAENGARRPCFEQPSSCRARTWRPPPQGATGQKPPLAALLSQPGWPEGRSWGQLGAGKAGAQLSQGPYLLTGAHPKQNKTKQMRSGEQVGRGCPVKEASRPVMFTSPGSGGGRSPAYPFPSLSFSISFRVSSRNGGAGAHPDLLLPRPTRTDTGRRKQKARVGGSPL